MEAFSSTTPHPQRQLNKKLHILVPCTGSKTKKTSPNLDFSNLSGTLLEKFEKWCNNANKENNKHLAHDLYCGPAWSQVKIIKETFPAAKIWIVSAGFGLIPWDARIPSYSITFSPNQPESIQHEGPGASKYKRNLEWWNYLSTWASNPGPTESVTTKDLLDDRHNRIISALPKTYLKVLEKDFITKHSADLLIFSSDSSLNPILKDKLIQLDSRLPLAIGGTRQIMILRLIWKINIIINKGSINSIRDKVSQLMKNHEIIKYRRKPLSDEEVIQYITLKWNEIKSSHSSPSRSRILRTLRDEGFACEQKRFKNLYLRLEPTLL